MSDTINSASRARGAPLLVPVGMCAALHIWKLPPALPELQAEFHLSLVASGFLLSIVQVGGLLLGLSVGLMAQWMGLRRCIVAGLAVLAAASLAGALFDTSLMLLVTRGIEGCGFLMVVMPIPPLMRKLVPPQGLSRVMGLWGCYMPLASGLALLTGGWVLDVTNWRLLWVALAALTLLCLFMVLLVIPSEPDEPGERTTAPSGGYYLTLIGKTLRSSNVWLIALTFGFYAAQWIAVIGFLPTIYAAQDISGSLAGTLTALVAASNAVGNFSAGRLLYRHAQPWQLLVIGLTAMIVFAFIAFGTGLPAQARFIAIVLFSMIGGIVPTTLFVLALQLAPSVDTTPTTIGWVQQCSCLGQFCGPPLVAWVVNLAGNDWQWSWVPTGALAACGIVTALILRTRTRDMRQLPA